MKVSIDEIQKTLEHALIQRGLSKEISEIVALEYLEGELRGKKTHGLMAFPSLLGKVSDFAGKDFEIEKQTDAMISVEANGLPGSYVGQKVADLLLQKAKVQGVAVGYIKNMTAWLRPETIARYVAEHNMVGFVINNGGKPMIAPSGGYDPVVGTNPIGIGIPAHEEPIVVDMATSKRAWGEVRKALINKTDLPSKSFFTSTGEYAVQPEDAHSAEAFGDYKGFALALFIEIMTGSFLDRAMGSELETDEYRTKTRGGMVLIMDPTFTSDVDEFKKENSKLTKGIKEGSKRKGAENILIPGERALKSREENSNNGYLEVEDHVWEQLIS